jgi:hypothetical protein
MEDDIKTVKGIDIQRARGVGCDAGHTCGLGHCYGIDISSSSSSSSIKAKNRVWVGFLGGERYGIDGWGETRDTRLG